MRDESRSAAAVVAYLMRRERKPMDEILQVVGSHRRININENFIEQLKTWNDVQYTTWKDEEMKIRQELMLSLKVG